MSNINNSLFGAEDSKLQMIQFIERIENLMKEGSNVADDIKEIYTGKARRI